MCTAKGCMQMGMLGIAGDGQIEHEGIGVVVEAAQSAVDEMCCLSFVLQLLGWGDDVVGDERRRQGVGAEHEQGEGEEEEEVGEEEAVYIFFH